ncbi:MAG: hypothetical protein QXY72_04580 [Nitrososphaerota archaeon]
MISNDVKVYLLREGKLIKQKRVEKNRKERGKNENDAIVLSMISKEFFRELKLEEIQVKKQLQPLISRYEVLTKRILILKQWLKDSDNSQLKSLIKELEKEKTKIGDEIHEKVMDDRLYSEALRYFGLKKSIRPSNSSNRNRFQ